MQLKAIINNIAKEKWNTATACSSELYARAISGKSIVVTVQRQLYHQRRVPDCVNSWSGHKSHDGYGCYYQRTSGESANCAEDG